MHSEQLIEVALTESDLVALGGRGTFTGAAVPRTVANAATGYLVDALGWTPFFLLCTVLALPGMLLLYKVAPWGDDPPAQETDAPRQSR